MTRICALLSLGIVLLCAGSAAAVGDLYVVQIGDGGAALTSASTAIFVKKFDASSGSSLSSIALPTAPSGLNLPLTVSGTSGSEGHLNLTTNGQYLTVGGYGAAPGLAAVAQTDSATVNRVIGRIELSSGAVDTTTALTDAYTGLAANNAGFRSVVSVDGTAFWTAGTRGFGAPSGSDGVRYATLGATTSTSVANFPNGPSNVRIVDIFDGQLYLGSGSSGFVGISKVGTGLPTGTGETATLDVGTAVSGSGTASPYAFWFKDANTAYVADDRSTALGGGVQKWTFDGAVWSLAYTLNANPSGGSVGARGLDGRIVGTDTVLYATTAESSANKLVAIVDTGASATASLLATAPTNTAFRGVAFVAPPAGVAGDYNGNGIVDGADYVLWRDGGTLQNDPNPGNPTAQYNFWRSRFGATSGGGAALGGSAAVPEPASAILMLVGLAAFRLRRAQRLAKPLRFARSAVLSRAIWPWRINSRAAQP